MPIDLYPWSIQTDLMPIDLYPWSTQTDLMPTDLYPLSTPTDLMPTDLYPWSTQTDLMPTGIHLMPRLSNIFWMVVSSFSTMTRFGSSISTFIDSHLDDIHSGWSATYKQEAVQRRCGCDVPLIKVWRT